MARLSYRTRSDLIETQLQWHQRIVALCGAAKSMELLDTHDVTDLTYSFHGGSGSGKVDTYAVAPRDKFLVVGLMLADTDTPRLWFRVGDSLVAKVFYEHACHIVVPMRQSYGFQISYYAPSPREVYRHPPCQVRLYGWAIDEKLYETG